MYERLRDCPALNQYSSSIPAPVWNVWRRFWMREQRKTCFGLEGLPPMSMLLDDGEWVLVDDRVPGRGVRSNQEVIDSGMAGMSVRLSRRTG
jgi:hypothetical protein